MGKLFWKFFAIFVLAQFATMAGVSVVVWLKTLSSSQAHFRHPPQPLEVFVDAAAATLRSAGRDGVEQLLAEWESRPGTPTVFVVDEAGHDVHGRALPASQAMGQSDPREPPSASVPRRVAALDGALYQVFARREHHANAFVGNPGESGPPEQFRPPPRGFMPMDPIFAGIVVSLVFGAALAWSFSRPIRSLRAAFEEASKGSLSIRLSPAMRGRADEFADLARDFDHMVERIGALMDGQRRLLHDVSHELRSPLARLQLAVGLARQQPDRVAATLDRVDREALRMDALIDELLTLSRLEAGVIGALDEEVKVLELIDGIVEDARFEAASRNRKISFSHGPAVSVKGRATLLHRAIENVVRNAITHTDEETDVHIDARTDENGALRVQIDDHGPGIPHDSLPFVFRPFFRAQGSHGAARKGHGLGLAIAKRIVDAHEGRINASNRDSGGLRVEIVLPVSLKALEAA